MKQCEDHARLPAWAIFSFGAEHAQTMHPWQMFILVRSLDRPRCPVWAQALQALRMLEPSLVLEEATELGHFAETLDAIVSIKDRSTRALADGFISVIVITV